MKLGHCSDQGLGMPFRLWRFSCVAMVLLLGLPPNLAAVAQNAIQNPFQPGPKSKSQNKNLAENHADHLKDFVDTPGVPKYAGKYSFTEGVIFPAAKTGPSITMKFNAHEKPQEVLHWYRSVFEQGRWEIEKCTTDDIKRVGATKDKNICRVMVEKGSDPFFPSRVVLTYRLYRGSSN